MCPTADSIIWPTEELSIGNGHFLFTGHFPFVFKYLASALHVVV